MKKFLILFSVLATMFIIAPTTEVQSQTVTSTTTLSSTQEYSGYLAVKDTLTDTDSTNYVLVVRGQRHCITFGVDIIKLTGTVAGKFEVYGSVNGTTWVTTPILTVNLTDASANLKLGPLEVNGYAKYLIVNSSSGTNTHSQRTSVTVRKL